MHKKRISVNDKEFVFETDNLTISALLEKLKIQAEGIAVCVNGDIIRKKNFSEYVLNEGDKVDIITMV
ncbi:MAG: sulfur carrier protein ThiS, partial [Deltaproteobacteria bacterium]|nr:sulfur carrier protein ThiS [Deltaproteobacteria bacterium]